MVRRHEYISEIDKFIGGKIYSLRLAKGVSRQQLADSACVTYQQFRKYEKGYNCISAGRLVLIAKALSVDANHFYEGIDTMKNEPDLTEHQRMCIEVSRNFMKIESAKQQNAINILIKSLINVAS